MRSEGAIHNQEITEWDRRVFQELIDPSLTPEQQSLIEEPPMVMEREEAVLAVHWHPEQVPLELARRRIDGLFPNRRKELIVPTQHNELLCWEGLCGAEVDCYAPEIDRPVQLLVHLREEMMPRAGVLQAMLGDIRRRREERFMEILAALTDDHRTARLERAARGTGATPEIVSFVSRTAAKLRTLIEHAPGTIPEMFLRNRLLMRFIRRHRGRREELFLARAQMLVKEVKKTLKKEERYTRWVTAPALIEEVRGLGGGIVVPHPEEFWPILGIRYPVDGYEIWNPRSREFTESLLSFLADRNAERKSGRPLLPFMGDDCHLGELLANDGSSTRRERYGELGVQAGWREEGIERTLLQKGGFSKETVMEEYRERITA